MAIRSTRVTVGTTATRLSSSPNDNRADASVTVQAPDGATLYVGGADVTAATGFPVAAGTTISGELQHGEDLYGVLASGSGTTYVFESGV